MTLVVSLISQQSVIQVSDRRLVWLEPDGRIRRKDDRTNKSVLWCRRLAFAYTGIAQLGNERRTDLWLAAQMAGWESSIAGPEVDQGELIQAITDRATDYFNGPRISRLSPDQRRHAFAGVGWARFERGSEFEPYLVQIANFVADRPADESFSWTVHRLRDREIFVAWIGQDLNATERGRLQALSYLDPSTDGFADRASFVLGETIRTVAARNELVGRGLLITALPRSSIAAGQTGGMLIAGGALPNQQTFLYVPPDAQEAVQYGPTYTCGGARVANFEARSPAD